MKKKFTLLTIFSYLSVLILNLYACSAADISEITFDCSQNEYKRGETIILTSNISSPQNKTLSCLEMHIDFDSDKLEFKSKSKNKSKVKLDIDCSGNTVSLSYTNQNGLYVEPSEPAKIFDISFKVKKTAEYGNTEIKTKIENVRDENNEIIETNPEIVTSISIPEPDLSKSMLKTLIPSVGKLSPEFNPQTYNYTLDVPYTAKDLNFEFSPLNEDSTAKINRHKLNAAGKETVFKITVSNKEENLKSIYTINVFRAPPPPKQNNSSKSKTKTQNKSKSSTSTSKSTDNYKSHGTINKIQNDFLGSVESSKSTKNNIFLSESCNNNTDNSEFDNIDTDYDFSEENEACEDPEYIENDKEEGMAFSDNETKTDAAGTGNENKNYISQDDICENSSDTIPVSSDNKKPENIDYQKIILILMSVSVVLLSIYNIIEIIRFSRHISYIIKPPAKHNIYMD